VGGGRWDGRLTAIRTLDCRDAAPYNLQMKNR
jgi:hypothetical protein